MSDASEPPTAPDGPRVHYVHPPLLTPPPANGMATASMVLGIVGVCMFWSFGFGALLGLLAVIFGFIGLGAAKSLPGQLGRGKAIAGLATGAAALVLGVAFFVVIVIAASEAVDDLDENIGDELGELNSDPVDGHCNTDRYYQDPDC
jgi:hypothetical protein